jgi:hypothetical protein
MGTVIAISANLEYKVQQDATILTMLLLLAYLNRIKLIIKVTRKETEMLNINYVNFKKNEHLCYSLKQRYTNEKRYN